MASGLDLARSPSTVLFLFRDLLLPGLMHRNAMRYQLFDLSKMVSLSFIPTRQTKTCGSWLQSRQCFEGYGWMILGQHSKL